VLLVGQLSSASTAATLTGSEGRRQEAGRRSGASTTTMFHMDIPAVLSVGVPQGDRLTINVPKTYTKYNIPDDVHAIEWNFVDNTDADLSSTISLNNTDLNMSTTRYSIFAVVPLGATAGTALSIYAIPDASLSQLSLNTKYYTFSIVMLFYNTRETWRKWQNRLFKSIYDLIWIPAATQFYTIGTINGGLIVSTAAIFDTNIGAGQLWIVGDDTVIPETYTSFTGDQPR
jgi:hypothetical protein